MEEHLDLSVLVEEWLVLGVPLDGVLDDAEGPAAELDHLGLGSDDLVVISFDESLWSALHPTDVGVLVKNVDVFVW